MAKKHPIDWVSIEKDFRAGIKSNLQIAREHKITEGAIRKKAKDYEWKKDLADSIRARAAQLMQAQEVREEIRASIDDAEIIENNAQLQANVLREHRSDIQEHRKLASNLLAELKAVSNNQELFEKLGELLIDTSPKENGKVDQEQYKRMEALKRAIDMSGRVDSLKKLSDTLKTLIALEREAFSIDDKSKVQETIEDFLSKLE